MRPMKLSFELLRALINPRADNANFFRRQRLRGWALARATGTAGTTTWRAILFFRATGGSGCAFRFLLAAGTTWPGTAGATPTRALLRRHGGIRVDAGDGFDNQAFRAVTHRQNFSLLATGERSFAGGQVQSSFRLLCAVAFDAGRIEDRLDVFVERQAGFRGGGRQGFGRRFGCGRVALSSEAVAADHGKRCQHECGGQFCVVHVLSMLIGRRGD